MTIPVDSLTKDTKKGGSFEESIKWHGNVYFEHVAHFGVFVQSFY